MRNNVNLRVRIVVRLGDLSNIGLGGGGNRFEITFITDKQVIKSFKREQCLTGTD